MVEALERSDTAAVRVELAERLAGWDPAPWIAERWRPQLDEIAGGNRRVTGARRVSEVMARAVVEGDRGRAFVSVFLHDGARVAGLGIDSDERDGRFGIVVGCTQEQARRLEPFYRRLVRGPIGFGEGGAQPPRWGDPARPAQLHLDVLVADLDAAEDAVLQHGATKLTDFVSWRVFADSAGHPFCLYPGLDKPTDRVGLLARVVIDCAEPEVLASFWGGLLRMPLRIQDSPDRVVIACEHRSLPMVALQHVPDHHRPRWPDPDHPAQMHLDIGFDDRALMERTALHLGATRLPSQGGSCPVYADPAGHPFCLCYKGE